MEILKKLRKKIKDSKQRVFTKQELYYIIDTFEMCEKIRYTETDMLSFAKISTEGSYGSYKNCKSIELKLERYNKLNSD